MKKTDAKCTIEVYCNCPYCLNLIDVFKHVRELLEDDHRAENIDVEISCDGCGELFIIENVSY